MTPADIAAIREAWEAYESQWGTGTAMALLSVLRQHLPALLAQAAAYERIRELRKELDRVEAYTFDHFGCDAMEIIDETEAGERVRPPCPVCAQAPLASGQCRRCGRAAAASPEKATGCEHCAKGERVYQSYCRGCLSRLEANDAAEKARGGR